MRHKCNTEGRNLSPCYLPEPIGIEKLIKIIKFSKEQIKAIRFHEKHMANFKLRSVDNQIITPEFYSQKIEYRSVCIFEYGNHDCKGLLTLTVNE